MDTTTTKRDRASPYFVFSVLCLVLIASLLIPVSLMSTTAHSVIPSPKGQPPGAEAAAPVNPEQQWQQQEEGESGLFSAVDWYYWQSVNPAIIGWITVPGTNIDYAVVQAPNDNPTYYLDHDIYGGWNPYGCPYVDASCESTTGLSIVVFGHNMGYEKSMFSDFASYFDAAFAKEHPQILFQTPTEKLVLDVSAVAIVRGTEPSKRTGFTSQAELASWYEGVYDTADVRVAYDPYATRLFTFVTCSYHYFSNERTLVFAQLRTESHNNN
jgi:sortase B